MKTLGFDLDGVIYPWHDAVYNYVTTHMGVTETFENFWTEFDANYTDIWRQNILDTLHLYANIVPKPRHLLLLHELSKRYRIIYITARDEIKLGWVTHNYLKRYNYPNYEEVYFSKFKRPIIIEQEVDFFVEDKKSHVQELIGFTDLILMKTIYNKDIWDVVSTIRSLDELPETLKRIENKL